MREVARRVKEVMFRIIMTRFTVASKEKGSAAGANIVSGTGTRPLLSKLKTEKKRKFEKKQGLGRC